MCKKKDGKTGTENEQKISDLEIDPQSGSPIAVSEGENEGIEEIKTLQEGDESSTPSEEDKDGKVLSKDDLDNSVAEKKSNNEKHIEKNKVLQTGNSEKGLSNSNTSSVDKNIESSGNNEKKVLKKASSPSKKEDRISDEESKSVMKKETARLKFRPIPVDGSEVLKGFHLPTRTEIVDSIIKKHKDFVEKFKMELKEIDKPPKEIIEESDEEKKRRDSINEVVAGIKNERTKLKEKNKMLRNEFFELLHKEERVQIHSKEIKVHRSYILDLDWKLSTEAIDIQTERRLMDELRDTMQKIRNITDGLTPSEIREKLTEIEQRIAENLVLIEDLHSRLLEKVEESNIHHEKFIDAKKKLKEKESRRGWLDRRIQLHEEMAIFWEGQINQAKKIDEEESKRTLDSIKERLSALFEDRDRTDPGKRGETSVNHKRSGPRKKLEIKKGNVKEQKKSDDQKKTNEKNNFPVNERIENTEKEKPADENDDPKKTEHDEHIPSPQKTEVN